MEIDRRFASPNHSSRHGKTIEGVVVHYTGGGNALGSVRWLCDREAGVSAHFVISRSGTVWQIVPLSRAAWHAGKSEMWTRGGEVQSEANLFTIGIELANHGNVRQIDGDFYFDAGGVTFPYHRATPWPARLEFDNGKIVEGFWERYPDAQLDALQSLLLWIANEGHKEAASNLVGHEEIAMPLGRKIDPGPLFPWDRFGRRAPRRTKSKPWVPT